MVPRIRLPAQDYYIFRGSTIYVRYCSYNVVELLTLMLLDLARDKITGEFFGDNLVVIGQLGVECPCTLAIAGSQFTGLPLFLVVIEQLGVECPSTLAIAGSRFTGLPLFCLQLFIHCWIPFTFGSRTKRLSITDSITLSIPRFNGSIF